VAVFWWSYYHHVAFSKVAVINCTLMTWSLHLCYFLLCELLWYKWMNLHIYSSFSLGLWFGWWYDIELIKFICLCWYFSRFKDTFNFKLRYGSLHRSNDELYSNDLESSFFCSLWVVLTYEDASSHMSKQLTDNKKNEDCKSLECNSSLLLWSEPYQSLKLKVSWKLLKY